MGTIEKVKMLTLEIINLIDNGNPNDFKTYGKIGDNIEKLADLRLDIVKTPINGVRNADIL